MGAPTTPTKAELRTRALAARRSLTPEDRTSAGRAITRNVLGLPELTSARAVAAFHSIGTEPDTHELVEALRSTGITVLLPVLRDDLDLDWAAYAGPTSLATGTRGLWMPTGPRLGLDAVRGADVVVVPALAVDEHGVRLGRGGGSYDRALARVPADCPVVTLLYEGEIVPDAAGEPHDQRVDVVVTDRGVRRFA